MKLPFLAAALALLAGPAHADTLISNVNGVQVGADGQLRRFRGLVIGDDGKVRTTVANPELVRLAGITRSIDGGGRTLLPGLIDAHGHLIDSPGGDMGLGLLLVHLDLTGTSSLDDLKNRVAAYARANPGPEWISGRGWNEELWAGKRAPTAADLDSVIADRPVLLVRVDGHAAVANSAALKAAGINSETAVPAGGAIVRDKDGSPTGLFIDNAIGLVASHVPPPGPALMDRGLQEAQRMLLANGITAIGDMGTSIGGWQAMQRAGSAGRLKLRVVSYFDATAAEEIPADAPTDWLFGDRLRLVGMKIFADGSLGSRGAWLKRAYADKPDSQGLRFLSDAELRDQAGRASAAGFQLAIHAIGDAAVAQAISLFETLGGGASRRWRIEHFQVADPADIARLAPAGIIASMQPVHQTSDRTMAEARLGSDRLDGAYAWQSVLKSGARLAFGSDFPVESPNPFPGLAAAVSRQDMAGQPPGGWIPAERLSFAEALSAFTRGAAFAGFAEDRIGSLDPGKWADFILVDRDVTAVDPQALGRTQVLETWIAGEKVWERPPEPSGIGERG